MAELYRKYRELIVYFIVGCLTTLVNWAVYAAGVEWGGWSVAVSNTVAWIAAVAFAYITNKVWVFRSFNWSPAYILREAMLAHGFQPLPEEWWHFTLENEPFPDTYFTFPVNSDSISN